MSGKGTFVLEIDNFSCNITAAVTELTVDGIIGLDFLTEYRGEVGVTNQELCIGELNKFHMVKKGHFGWFRAVNMNSVTIPVNQEVVVPGQICVP